MVGQKDNPAIFECTVCDMCHTGKDCAEMAGDRYGSFLPFFR